MGNLNYGDGALDQCLLAWTVRRHAFMPCTRLIEHAAKLATDTESESTHKLAACMVRFRDAEKQNDDRQVQRYRETCLHGRHSTNAAPLTVFQQ